jgi:hypothetical protein
MTLGGWSALSAPLGLSRGRGGSQRPVLMAILLTGAGPAPTNLPITSPRRLASLSCADQCSVRHRTDMTDWTCAASPCVAKQCFAEHGLASRRIALIGLGSASRGSATSRCARFGHAGHLTATSHRAVRHCRFSRSSVQCRYAAPRTATTHTPWTPHRTARRGPASLRFAQRRAAPPENYASRRAAAFGNADRRLVELCPAWLRTVNRHKTCVTYRSAELGRVTSRSASRRTVTARRCTPHGGVPQLTVGQIAVQHSSAPIPPIRLRTAPWRMASLGTSRYGDARFRIASLIRPHRALHHIATRRVAWQRTDNTDRTAGAPWSRVWPGFARYCSAPHSTYAPLGTAGQRTVWHGCSPRRTAPSAVGLRSALPVLVAHRTGGQT